MSRWELLNSRASKQTQWKTGDRGPKRTERRYWGIKQQDFESWLTLPPERELRSPPQWGRRQKCRYDHQCRVAGGRWLSARDHKNDVVPAMTLFSLKVSSHQQVTVFHTIRHDMPGWDMVGTGWPPVHTHLFLNTRQLPFNLHVLVKHCGPHVLIPMCCRNTFEVPGGLAEAICHTFCGLFVADTAGILTSN